MNNRFAEWKLILKRILKKRRVNKLRSAQEMGYCLVHFKRVNKHKHFIHSRKLDTKGDYQILQNNCFSRAGHLCGDK